MPATDRYTLGPYLVDLDSRRVTRDGVPLKLAWRHFEALKLLLDANQDIVPKERFFQTLWPDTPIVDESNLTQCISQLRKALGNGDHTPFVENVPRIGYRLLVPVAKRSGVELNHVATPASATVATRVSALSEPARSRSRLGIAAVIVVLVALAAAGGSWWWWTSRPTYLSRAAQVRGNEFGRAGDAKAAVQEFQLAVQLDPQNAVAYSELAHALQRLSFKDSYATPAGESPSVKAATRAVEIDPMCAGCHATLGFFLFYHDWKWSEAESHFTRALQLASGPGVGPSYALLLAATGRLREALEQIDRALSARPLEVGWHVIRATILYLDRRFEESIAAGAKALAITESERGPWEWRSKALFQLGRGEEAIKALAEVAFAEHSSRLDAAVRAGGRDAGLRTLLEITDDWRSHKEQAWRRAPWRALLGDTDGALSELETAYELRNVNLIYIATDPVYDPIRDQPRFQRILKGMGLP